ncbi:MAG TPA: DUF4232 domain-containing protein [Streptosporangiaceae bacterium]|nr:DUF4232 domain-containing protein [Streptosporangiaceae bacterium]
MPLSAHTARRVAAALALACAAALSVTAASAAVNHHSHPRATPACSVSRLQVWIGLPGSGSAGATAYPLEFSNISGRACHLFGFPGVSAVGGNGHQLGSAAGRDPAFRPRLVLLGRGATAHALLTITEAGNFPAGQCRMRTAVGLRVSPPGQRRSAFVPLTFPACSKKGPVYLHVRAIRGGVGIPGFSQ